MQNFARDNTIIFQAYNDPHRRTTINIIGLQESEPGLEPFSHITLCFTPDQQDHRAIRMGWTPNMDIDNHMRDFKVNFRNAVAEAAQITKLRVTGIQVGNGSALVVILQRR